MTLSDSDEDADYVPSEFEESDELEYDSDVSVSTSDSNHGGQVEDERVVFSWLWRLVALLGQVVVKLD